MARLPDFTILLELHREDDGPSEAECREAGYPSAEMDWSEADRYADELAHRADVVHASGERR